MAYFVGYKFNKQRNSTKNVVFSILQPIKIKIIFVRNLHHFDMLQ